MIREHGLTESLARGIAVLRQPMLRAGSPPGSHHVERAGRPLVLWAGRFCLQKNVNLLIEIASRAPNFQFHVYGEGEGDPASRLRDAERKFGNLTLCGPFSSFDLLPIDQYFSFLFTSLWEGLPTSLISAASLGIPIVASDVGGVSELVDDETGWLIRDHTRPDSYLDALEEIWRKPSEATWRVERMFDRVTSQHSWSAYMDAFSETPSFLDGLPQ
jgi:glycosyltransferase involved in cell wall biosynthesis